MWLNENISDGLLLCNTNNYNLIRCNRPARGGGVRASIHKRLYCMQVSVPPEYVQLELLCFDNV